MKKLKDKIVFLTDGNSGMGKVSALQYPEKGGTFVLVNLEDKIYKLSIYEIMTLCAKCNFKVLDISNIVRIKQALDFTIEKLYRIYFPIKNYLKIGSAFLLIVLSITGFMSLYIYVIYK